MFPSVIVTPEKAHLCPVPLPHPLPAPLGYVNSYPDIRQCTLSSANPLLLQRAIYLVLFEFSQCQPQRGLCGSRTPRNLRLSPSASLEIVLTEGRHSSLFPATFSAASLYLARRRRRTKGAGQPAPLAADLDSACSGSALYPVEFAFSWFLFSLDDAFLLFFFLCFAVKRSSLLLLLFLLSASVLHFFFIIIFPFG